MKKIKMLQNSELTFKEGYEKHLDDCRERNLRQGTISHYKRKIVHKTWTIFAFIYFKDGIFKVNFISIAKNPITGDSSNLFGAIYMMALPIIMLITIIVWKKKERSL